MRLVQSVAVLGAIWVAQTVPSRTLTGPAVEYPEPFTSIGSVRELRDGRVLIADIRENTIQVIDLRNAGSAKAIGREGSGPGEYRSVARLLALPGDSTLLFDPANSRYLVILPDATPGPTFTLPSDTALRRTGAPMAVDAAGRLYFLVTRIPAGPPRMESGSEADVIRYDRATHRIDTLALLGLPKGRTQGARSLPGGMLRFMTNMPFALEDVAAVAADGRVALVRAKDYHVEWVSPDKRVVTGASTSYSRIAIDAEEKQAFLDSQTRPGQIFVSGGPGAAARGVGSSGGRAAPIPRGAFPDDAKSMTWPEFKPPFLAQAAITSPDGRVWVLRTRAHTDSIVSYDVFDAQGRLAERVRLPKASRLVGFGNGVVYVARIDEDDLQHLQRFRW